MVVAFSLFLTSASTQLAAQEEAHAEHAATETKFNPGETILHHISDAHEWHFFSIKNADGTKKDFTIPLPVILYSPQRGFTSFMSSKFHHGKQAYEGYKLEHGKVVPVDANGNVDETVKVYNFSMTKNVVQMLLALIVLVWIMSSVAGKYKTGQGVTSAPKGLQNAI